MGYYITCLVFIENNLAVRHMRDCQDILATSLWNYCLELHKGGHTSIFVMHKTSRKKYS